MVMEVVQEDMGEGSMHCTDHPYKNSTPGGICAFCLQEKLRKLVASSFPIAAFPSSSLPSSPSFRSDTGSVITASSAEAHPNACSSANSLNVNHKIKTDGHYYSRRSRMSSLLNQSSRKKENKETVMATSDQTAAVLKRSKSTTTPGMGAHFLEDDGDNEDYGPHRRGFWSFPYLSKQSSSRKMDRPFKDTCHASSATAGSMVGSSSLNGSFPQQRARDGKKKEDFVLVDDKSPDRSSFEKRVSRSRSIGCGSRSFSGDFFERISSGFGDCTLRRVESQREGKPKVTAVLSGGGAGQDCIRERVKCRGIFSGFIITSSSSSSSSSSTEDNVNGKTAPATATAPAVAVAGHLTPGRTKSWGWAFASPIRALSKPSSGKREASNKNAIPNLAAIPSLLAARG